MTQTTFNYAEAIRNQRDFHGKPTQTYTINGKTIKTNYGVCEYPYWDGNTSNVPEKYSRFGTIKRLGFRQSSKELFNYLVDCGYDEIRVVLVASGQILGYCDEFFWACKSEVVKARKNELKEEKNAKELEEAKENMVEAIKICCGIKQPETAPETESNEMNQPEPEKVTESKSQPVRRLCGAPRLVDNSNNATDEEFAEEIRQLTEEMNKAYEQDNISEAKAIRDKMVSLIDMRLNGKM